MARRDRTPAILMELVEAGVISRPQLEIITQAHASDGGRIIALLVDAGFATERQITQVVNQQFSVPWVSLCHVRSSQEVLNLVSYELAQEFCLVPLFVRRVRPGKVLYVATDDPSDDEALEEVGERVGLPVRAMVAPPSALRAAIRDCYGGGTG